MSRVESVYAARECLQVSVTQPARFYQFVPELRHTDTDSSGQTGRRAIGHNNSRRTQHHARATQVAASDNRWIEELESSVQPQRV